MKEKVISTGIQKTANILVDQQGFDSTHDFFDSLFQIHNLKLSMSLTLAFTGIASFIETHLGIKAIVLLGIVLLFIVEMGTGILYARKNNIYDSYRAPRGLVKMGIYMSMIGISHLFAMHLPVPKIPYMNWDFNFYWPIYYFFLNLTIVNLFISCVENCVKLGWEEYIPMLVWLKKILRLKLNTKSEDNGKPE